MTSTQTVGRKIQTPAGGHTVFAQQFDGDYRIVDEQGRELGFARRVPRGSRAAWSIAAAHNGAFRGAYADLAHAAQGILALRERDTP